MAGEDTCKESKSIVKYFKLLGLLLMVFGGLRLVFQ